MNVLVTGNNAIYNIGTGVETSDRKLFDSLAKALGYFENPIHLKARCASFLVQS